MTSGGSERRRELARLALVGLATLGLGYALGAQSADSILAPLAAPVPSSAPAAVASEGPSPAALEARREKLERVKTLDGEIATLARALARPQDYRTATAVLDDLGAFEASCARRAALTRELGEAGAALAPVPDLPAGLRERARAIEGAGALGLAVRGVPQD